MNARQLIRAVMGLALAAGVSACKAKVDAKNDTPPAPVFADQVGGPVLDGDWQGHCVEDGWGAGYVIFNYSFQGHSLLRSETKFTDNKCTMQESQLTRAGVFRFVTLFSTGVFAVEYKIQIAGGSYLLKENLKLVGDSLWVSDRETGETVDPDIELTKVPVPTP